MSGGTASSPGPGRGVSPTRSDSGGRLERAVLQALKAERWGNRRDRPQSGLGLDDEGAAGPCIAEDLLLIAILLLVERSSLWLMPLCFRLVSKS